MTEFGNRGNSIRSQNEDFFFFLVGVREGVIEFFSGFHWFLNVSVCFEMFLPDFIGH